MSRVCEILGCQFPVIEGGLAYVGNGSLAAAVSNGGGFGQVGSGGRTPNDLDRELQIALQETSRPIGVNIPISEHRDPAAHLAIVEKYAHRIKAVSLSAGNPRPYIPYLKNLGFVVMSLASTPEQALKAESAGADIVVCEGTEAGGHNGPAELTTLTLIPLVKQSVSIPIVAAGGIGDGRTAAAAFCLGADAVQLGTRFVATHECQAHQNYKNALIQARYDDTTVIERSLGRITRVLKNSYAEMVQRAEGHMPGDANKLLPLVSGRYNAVAALEGHTDEGWMNCGQSVALITELLSASEVARSVMEQARKVMQAEAYRFNDF